MERDILDRVTYKHGKSYKKKLLHQNELEVKLSTPSLHGDINTIHHLEVIWIFADFLYGIYCMW